MHCYVCDNPKYLVEKTYSKHKKNKVFEPTNADICAISEKKKKKLW